MSYFKDIKCLKLFPNGPNEPIILKYDLIQCIFAKIGPKVELIELLFTLYREKSLINRGAQLCPNVPKCARRPGQTISV